MFTSPGPKAASLLSCFVFVWLWVSRILLYFWMSSSETAQYDKMNIEPKLQEAALTVYALVWIKRTKCKLFLLSEAPGCLRKHERGWFTIALGKSPGAIWGQEMKKVQHTPPDIPHNRRNKQRGPERKPKAPGLISTGTINAPLGERVLEITKCWKNPPRGLMLTSVKDNPFPLWSTGCWVLFI